MKSLSCVQLLATPWTAAHQAPPSIKCIYLYNQDTELFHYPSVFPCISSQSIFFPQPQGTTDLLSVTTDCICLLQNFVEMELCKRYSFVFGFFDLAECSSSFNRVCITVVCSFLLLSSFTFYGCNRVYLFSSWLTLGLFPVSGCYESGCSVTCTQAQIHVFSLPVGWYTGVELLENHRLLNTMSTKDYSLVQPLVTHPATHLY